MKEFWFDLRKGKIIKLLMFIKIFNEQLSTHQF